MNELNEETYRRLKKQVDTAKTESERAKGALSQLMSQLKTEFGCETLKEAKVLLEEIEVKKNKTQKKFQEALAEYEKRWKEEE